MPSKNNSCVSLSLSVFFCMCARARVCLCACVESLTGTVVGGVVLWNKLPVGSVTSCYLWLR